MPLESVFISHMAFTVNAPRGTTWVQMVREPIGRMQSMYYYQISNSDDYTMRHGKANIEKRAADVRCGCAKQSFDACVRVRVARNCSLRVDSQLAYFTEGGHGGLEEAIANMRKYYTLVGHVEAFELSVGGFERLIPRFFRGASAMIRNEPDLLHGHRTDATGDGKSFNTKLCVWDTTRQLLAEHAENYAEERAFHEAARQHFSHTLGVAAPSAVACQRQR